MVAVKLQAVQLHLNKFIYKVLWIIKCTIVFWEDWKHLSLPYSAQNTVMITSVSHLLGHNPKQVVKLFWLGYRNPGLSTFHFYRKWDMKENAWHFFAECIKFWHSIWHSALYRTIHFCLFIFLRNKFNRCEVNLDFTPQEWMEFQTTSWEHFLWARIWVKLTLNSKNSSQFWGAGNKMNDQQPQRKLECNKSAPFTVLKRDRGPSHDTYLLDLVRDLERLWFFSLDGDLYLRLSLDGDLEWAQEPLNK